MYYVNFEGKIITFQEYYHLFFDTIYNYIYKLTLNRDVTYDIVSNVFLKALVFIKKNNVKINKSWIYRIAANEFYKFYNKNKRNKSFFNDDIKEPLDVIENQLDEVIIEKENLLLLRKLLNQLSDNDKLLVHMYFFEKKKYSEISKILNKKEGALRIKMYRILKKIRKKFNNFK